MLTSLQIENIAVIRQVNVDFHSGFSALTGETGAGKSLLIDSLNLLLGNRVSRELVRTGESRAIVSAVFESISEPVITELSEMGISCEDGVLLLQKTLFADGKSQTRMNGQIVTQAMQKKVAGMLVSIHGQSDSQKLLQKSGHLSLVDSYCKPDAELKTYRGVYHAYRELESKLAALSADTAETLRRKEMLLYQIADIDALKLREGEEEAAEKERDRLLNLEKLNQNADLAYRALSGGEKINAAALVRRAGSAISALSGIVDGAGELADRLSRVESELTDISETVLSFADNDIEDPTARIDRLESRLEAIAKLKRKYGSSIAEILAFRSRAAEELELIDCSDDRREELEIECNRLRKETEKLAGILHEKRKNAVRAITEQVTETLAFLDMPKVRFDIALSPCEPNENGTDEAEFLIASNPGEPLLPMTKIASGGELSRIMLSIRSVINDRDGAGTVVFDEIDTGISGKTSRKIGIKLLQTAKNAQVLCVTHSAQIASLADTHYQVSKTEREGRSETKVRKLTADERVEEIARILGGIHITDAQREAAREMIEEYRKEGTR
ncbi:MAG: DNA repair protein RecN [Ruminococcaceae bacterium]|nr:DNA repair protein RecN [Oscillospiraceae bacterium]